MTPPRSALPLAAAAVRLRGRPGRPRGAMPPPSEPAQDGHTAGTPPPRPRMASGPAPGALAPASSALLPRLLDLQGSAYYLSVSPWTVRDLEAAGVLARVRIPLPNGGELRKLLFDRQDLDRFVEVNKAAAESHRSPA